MKISIHSEYESTDISEAVERRLGFALARFSDLIHRVHVTLEDTNGPRGGVDKLCRIRVTLVSGRSPVIGEVTHEDMLAAIDLAAARVGRSVARAVDREQALRSG